MANNYADLSTSLVATAPSPATTGTSLVVTAGHGARFPTAPFYATVHPDGVFPTFDNAEIVLVSARATDTLTIDREEKGTTAKSIAIGWRISASIYASDLTGHLVNQYVYTYDGTDIFVNGVDQNNAANTINWTKPAGLVYAIVEVLGGGGGGGACDGNTSASAASGGGGGGGYSMGKIPVASLGSTEVVTVGGGGTAGATPSGAGGTGGTSSFGSHLQATGGVGGSGELSVTSDQPGGNGGSGGVGSGGDMNVQGHPGETGLRFGVVDTAKAGNGGSSHLGGGGNQTGGRTINSAGVVGGSYGGGGSGAHTVGNVDRAGGAGAAGVVIIREYFY